MKKNFLLLSMLSCFLFCSEKEHVKKTDQIIQKGHEADAQEFREIAAALGAHFKENEKKRNAQSSVIKELSQHKQAKL